VTFTLCTLNLNGVRAAEKRGFSRWLKRTAPDLLCLQEIRAWPDQVPAEIVAPAGYSTRWLCAEKKGYAGVGLYSKPAVDAYVVGSGLEWGDAEARVLRADVGDVSIVSLYIPSGSSSPERLALKYEFLDHIFAYTRKLLKSGRPVAICGDLNIAHTEIDIHNPKGNAKNSGFLPEERAWFTKLLRQGWVDVVRAQHPDEAGLYSWWSNRGQARAKDRGWRLDYVLASPALAERATRSWIEKKADLSDHAPVWVEFEGDAPIGSGLTLGE
jgi:exodeoxyribonuclease-3